MAWIDALPLDELAAKGKAVLRHEGRQILLLHTERGVFACANRCPHEGYPLSEGSLADGCVLTCNWHNWKFDLASGATLVGGDQLPRYPVRLEAGRVWLDVSPPDPELRRQSALRGVAKALEDGDQQRLVRETARLVRLGTDPAEAVAIAVSWVAERLEFGTTHAIAGAPDWLRLSEQPGIGDAPEDCRGRRNPRPHRRRCARRPIAFRCRKVRRRGTKRHSSLRSRMKTNRQRAPCCAGRSRPGARWPTCGPR